MSLLVREKTFNDTIPHVSAAGLVYDTGVESTEQCMKSDLDPRNQRPATPPEIKRFRKSYQEQPGVSFVHTGFVNQNMPPPHHRHGVKTTKGDHVGDTMAQVPASELTHYLNEQKESFYASNVREPLGVSYQRGHVLPDVTKGAAFDGFGLKSSISENAKGLIYFNEPIPNKEIISKSSKRAFIEPTNYHTAERDITRQLDREYNWPKTGIDPNTHRFGKVQPVDSNGVASSLTFSNATNLADNRVQQVKARSADHLGHTRDLRGALRGLAPDFAFGSVNAPDEWGTKKLIMGEYLPEEQMPDKDLGISTRKLSKLESVPSGVDMGGARVYGTPSLRGDLVKPRLRSVADGCNYGDESNAKGLLYPSAYTFEGVSESDFLLVRSASEIKELFERMGQSFEEGLFARACEAAKRDFGALSADSFRHALNKIQFEEQERRTGSAVGAFPRSTLEANALILSAVNFN